MKKIEWDEIHHRLKAVQETLEHGFVSTREEEKRILRTRAGDLAREIEKDRDEGVMEVLEFVLAHERYAVELRHIRVVVPLKELTRIPCTPPFILGVINVRGEMVSVVSLKKFFDLPEKDLTDLNRAIIVHNHEMEFGILADAVLGVRFISLKGIQPPPATLTGVHASYMKGAAGEGIVILDVERMLSDKRMVVCEEV